MKLRGADFARLRLGLIAALLMIGGGAVLAYLAYDMARAARGELALAQISRNEIDGRWKRVRSEESEIRQNLSLYASLRERGVIGEERRLEWVELLKAISERRRLLDLHYEFSPQRALDPAVPGAPAQPFAAHASSMLMQVELLHEEDLTRLLDDLRRQASALIQIRRCSLVRLPRASDGERKANLRAECQIDWITLSVAAGPGGRP